MEKYRPPYVPYNYLLGNAYLAPKWQWKTHKAIQSYRALYKYHKEKSFSLIVID